MRILVTGAAGFVGGHLLRHLRQRYPDARITGTVLEESNRLSDPQAQACVINLLDLAALESLVLAESPDWIIHLAASANVHRSFENPWATLENNIRAELNVLQSCAVHELRPRILIVTSGEVYGAEQSREFPTPEDAPMRPSNPYAVSKVAQDFLALQYHLSHRMPIMRARPFNHLGPGQGLGFVAPDLAAQIARVEAGQMEPRIRCGDLSAERDFTDVRDIVRAYVRLMEAGAPGEAYNVSTGSTHAIRELVEGLLALARVEIVVSANSGHIRSTGVNRSWGDSRKLRSATGWSPEIPLSTTLRDVLDDWRARVAAEVAS
jgi:GDP-4-dehydro-6-deoxy-D-mannose reductase